MEWCIPEALLIDVLVDQMVWWDAPPEDSQPFRVVLTYAQSSSKVISAVGPNAVSGTAAVLPQQ